MELVKLFTASILLVFAMAVYAGPKESESRTDQLKEATGETETYRTGSEEIMRTFSDTDGTGWNYCSGKCNKRVEKHKRAGGGTDKVIRVLRGSCAKDCSCVLFNTAGPKLVNKLEVEGKKGYLNIGAGNPADYSVRCVKRG